MAHTASLSQLQSPPWALVNGELIPYDEVKIHIKAEALTRALSVFEGVKGYWNGARDSFAIRSPERHYERLCRSAALLHIPIRFTLDEYLEGFSTLARVLLVPERDLWFRTTLYVTEGHWGEGTVADLVVTGFTQQESDPPPMRLGVSTWRRGGDVTLPARIKTSANYVIGRLARIEVKRLGCDEALLINDAGRIAEATGACVVIVDSGGIVTPPTSEGCLDSITVDVLEQVSRRLGIFFERRPIDRTELLTAKECGLAGTITELTLVDEVDGYSYEQNGVLAQVRQRYLDVMRGEITLPGVEMVPVLHTGDGFRSAERDIAADLAASP